MQLRPHQSRALDAIQNANKGCVYVPTGGGKTVIMMEDCKLRLQSPHIFQTIVVVAPRILLAVQLYNEFKAYLNDVDLIAAFTPVHSADVACYPPTTADHSMQLDYPSNAVLP